MTTSMKLRWYEWVTIFLILIPDAAIGAERGFAFRGAPPWWVAMAGDIHAIGQASFGLIIGLTLLLAARSLFMKRSWLLGLLTVATVASLIIASVAAMQPAGYDEISRSAAVIAPLLATLTISVSSFVRETVEHEAKSIAVQSTNWVARLKVADEARTQAETKLVQAQNRITQVEIDLQGVKAKATQADRINLQAAGDIRQAEQKATQAETRLLQANDARSKAEAAKAQAESKLVQLEIAFAQADDRALTAEAARVQAEAKVAELSLPLGERVRRLSASSPNLGAQEIADLLGATRQNVQAHLAKIKEG